MSIDLKQFQPARKPDPPARQEPTQRASWLNRDIQLFGQGLSLRKKEAFFLEFGILLKAGLDFKTALELVVEGMSKKDQEKIFEPVIRAVVQGAGLSEALEASGKFSAYDVYSVRIAEESGMMESVLSQLAAFYGQSMQHRRMVVSALSYPAVVIFTAVLSLSFLLNFLVPMFGDVYKRLHQDLPAITQMVVQMSAWFTASFRWIILSIAAVSTFFFYQRESSWFRRSSAWVLLRIPVVGSLLHLLYLNRFCSAMSFLSSAKVPVLDGLDLTQKMIRFHPLEVALEAIRMDILTGKSLHKSMERFPIFPKRLIALIKVGEEVNRLDQMFERLSDQYNSEAEHRIKSLGSLIEPVLIVFLALVVGFVLVAMYLPIFKLVTNFGG
ncbi:MAG: type II secretion system F family protein [Saprospiraceae bacterium]|nr:type II secretion system F family protein [Saprospiraceae bacterium]